jgi:O-antigen ligase
MIRGLRVQLLLAAVGGVALILLSSSGFTVWLLISLLLVGLPALKDRVLRLHRPGSLLAMIAFVLVGVALVYFSLAHVGSRLDIQENSSWSARLASLVWGLSYLGTSPSDLLFGVGPGQSYLLLQSPEASNLLPESSGELTVTAVWSVVVLYIQEMGLLGAVALALTLALVLRAIMRSSARLLGSSCLLAWLVGLLLTTSYLPMLPIWLLLGVLLNWDRIFEVRVPENGLDPGVPFVHKAMRT